MLNPKLSKFIFIGISILLLIIMPIIAMETGPNGDEDIEIIYGQDIYNYWAKGDKQALDYKTHPLGLHISNMEYYGGLVNLSGEVLYRWFGFDLVKSRHFIVGVLGALMMIFTGLFAYKSGRNNWLIGLLALFFIIFSPRLFGESFHNGKDITYAAGIIISIFSTTQIMGQINERSKKLFIYFLGLTFGIFLSFGARPAGGLLAVAFTGFAIVAILFFNKNLKKALLSKSNRKKVIFLFCSFVSGYAISLLFWPKGVDSPIGNLIEALQEMSNRDANFRMFFEGAYLRTKEVPWYYTLKWIFISSPIIVLIGYIGFILLGFKIAGKYSKSVVTIIIFCSLFPIAYTIIKQSTLLDTWRHSFFVFPFWVVGAALFVGYMAEKIKKPTMQVVPFAIALVGLSPEITWNFTTTPYQSIYFNALVGGIKGAQDKYELDYYQISSKEIRQWMQANAKPQEGNTVINFMSNMDAIFIDKPFMDDTQRVRTSYARFYDRHMSDWDYFATFGRFIDEWQLVNHTWPPCDATYKVELKGVPLAVILHRQTSYNFQAFKQLEAKNYEEALKLYELADQNGGLCNEMELFYVGLIAAQLKQYDKSISAIQRAIKINGEIPEFYDVLSQVYMAKGDTGSAEQTKRQFQSVKATKALKH